MSSNIMSHIVLVLLIFTLISNFHVVSSSSFTYFGSPALRSSEFAPAPNPAEAGPAWTANSPSYPLPPPPPEVQPSPPEVQPPLPSNPQVIKAAYWPSFDGFDATFIDTSYFTHIYYAFLQPDDTFKLIVTTFDQEEMPKFISAVKSQTPSIKTLLSIGGYSNNQTIFSAMASTNEARAIFINSTIEVARRYGFDGVDLDWEFPANAEEMFNLGLFFAEWRKAADNEARISKRSRLLLTSAVYYASKFTTFGEPRSYPSEAINNYVDWINPMCYDYHGSWENFTGAHSALHDPTSNLSTSYGIRSWIQSGVPPNKLVMGLALYGRTWKLASPYSNEIGARAIGVGPINGTLSYNEIIEFNVKNKSIVNFNGEINSYYSYAGDSWVGYDDIMSYYSKIQFARAWGLGGYFFWALGQDKDWTVSRLASSSWSH